MKKYIFASFVIGLLLGVGFMIYSSTSSIHTLISGDIPQVISWSVTPNTPPVGERPVDAYTKVTEWTSAAKEAKRLSENKDYTGAIALLVMTKDQTASPVEKSIFDFNIAANTFSLDRISGARTFMDLAKNPSYPPRTRALAMQRIYLMYRSYNDESILQSIASEMSIPWTSPDEVILEYMKRANLLYPLPGSAIYLLKNELTTITTKEQAEMALAKYKTDIDANIILMQDHPGELVEVTSAMLWRANIMAQLYRDYDIGTKGEVEMLYRDLIQFDQTKWLAINKQYTLLYYANFLADTWDREWAEKTLQILLTDWLHPNLVESLPKYREFTGLKNMTGATDKSIIDLIDYIWTK